MVGRKPEAMSQDVALDPRGIRRHLLTVLAILWALAAPPLVWWLGLVLWREAASCDPPSPPATISLTCALVFLAVGAGVVPVLIAAKARRWMPWVALLPSLGVLAVYTMIMIPAMTFGLSGHPDRVADAIPDVFVSYAPSLAVAGSAAVSLLANKSLRGMFVALSSWALVITALALWAAFATQAACGVGR
ncbi:ABC-type metal ion transport system, periplasmic component/surface adhesin [Microbacterium testaceum StLB037]|uniref:ABC-type metal ion transport system, periplasmic component/surface adhesin n=2 Tax=Microbacterium testaceum TaxID=2033 RepID=E8N746_MICTS|nr:ABC-type metal ion transport system, periplasmic component/surface adhesin [Microbacterium testaceum StLB037]